MLHRSDLEGKSVRGRKGVAFRLAQSEFQKCSATRLLNRLYSERGYGSDHCLPSDSSVTFTASCDDVVIGTITLTVDSEAGLAADRTFREEVEAFRREPGSRLCELTKFAFEPAPTSRPTLASLFHIVFIYGLCRYECSDLLIEVNPRHARFYEETLGFQPVGAVRTNEAVDAPAQLMWLKVSEIRRMIDLHAEGQLLARHSLYPHFFSKQEEIDIFDRITQLLLEEGLPRDSGGAELNDQWQAGRRSLAA